MRKISALPALAGIALVLLTACSPVDQDTAPEPTDTSETGQAEQTPTEDSGPVTLDVASAGEHYLDIACGTAKYQRLYTEAVRAGEEEFLAGGDPGMDKVRPAVIDLAESRRTAIELLDDDHYMWPSEVNDLVFVVQSMMMSELPYMDAISEADAYEDAYYAPAYTPTDEESSALDTLRERLNLDPDQATRCEGHSDNLERLADELAERNAALDD